MLMCVEPEHTWAWCRLVMGDTGACVQFVFSSPASFSLFRSFDGCACHAECLYVCVSAANTYKFILPRWGREKEGHSIAYPKHRLWAVGVIKAEESETLHTGVWSGGEQSVTSLSKGLNALAGGPGPSSWVAMGVCGEMNQVWASWGVLWHWGHALTPKERDKVTQSWGITAEGLMGHPSGEGPLGGHHAIWKPSMAQWHALGIQVMRL